MGAPDTVTSPGRGPVAEAVAAFVAASPVRAVDVAEVALRQLGPLGVVDIALLLADVQQRLLRPLAPNGRQPANVEGTMAGRAFRLGEAVSADGDQPGQSTWWLPVSHGARRVGVLVATVTDLSPDLGAALQVVAGLAAQSLILDAASSDLVVNRSRSAALALPAELQWALLPPLTAADPDVTVSGVLEPAYHIAGDSYDYAFDDGRVRLAVFDAMGHGLDAAMMATVAVGAYRQARRAGASVAETATVIDDAVGRQFGPDGFVTGMVAELDERSGRLTYLTAGHHPGLILRDGRIVGHLDAAGWLPLGLNAVLDVADLPSPAVADLEPGDRVLLYTDGVVEARSSDGVFFGLDRLEDQLVIEAASGSSTAETMRRLAQAVLEHQADELQDDATMLLAHWHPVMGAGRGSRCAG